MASVSGALAHQFCSSGCHALLLCSLSLCFRLCFVPHPCFLRHACVLYFRLFFILSLMIGMRRPLPLRLLGLLL